MVLLIQFHCDSGLSKGSSDPGVKSAKLTKPHIEGQVLRTFLGVFLYSGFEATGQLKPELSEQICCQFQGFLFSLEIVVWASGLISEEAFLCIFVARSLRSPFVSKLDLCTDYTIYYTWAPLLHVSKLDQCTSGQASSEQGPADMTTYLAIIRWKNGHPKQYEVSHNNVTNCLAFYIKSMIQQNIVGGAGPVGPGPGGLQGGAARTVEEESIVSVVGYSQNLTTHRGPSWDEASRILPGGVS